MLPVAANCDDAMLTNHTNSLSFDEEDGGDEVTRENVKEYIRLRKNDVMMGKRVKWLEAMKTGFQAIPLQSHLSLFTVYELMGIVCGNMTISAAALLGAITFSGFSSSFGGSARDDGGLTEQHFKVGPRHYY